MEGCGELRQTDGVYRFLRIGDGGEGFPVGMWYSRPYLGKAAGMHHWQYCGERNVAFGWQIFCERCCKKHGVLW